MKPTKASSPHFVPNKRRGTPKSSRALTAPPKPKTQHLAASNKEPKVVYVRQTYGARYTAEPQLARAHQQALKETVGALSHNIGTAVSQAMKPVKEGILLLQAVAAKHKPSRTQAIADVIHRWALPVVQVLLGAAVVVVGASIMEISIMVLGATMCATGLALCVTLLAGMLAPHPLDSLRDFVKRRQSHDPEFYTPGMVVALDGGG